MGAGKSGQRKGHWSSQDLEILLNKISPFIMIFMRTHQGIDYEIRSNNIGTLLRNLIFVRLQCNEISDKTKQNSTQT